MFVQLSGMHPKVSGSQNDFSSHVSSLTDCCITNTDMISPVQILWGFHRQDHHCFLQELHRLGIAGHTWCFNSRQWSLESYPIFCAYVSPLLQSRHTEVIRILKSWTNPCVTSTSGTILGLARWRTTSRTIFSVDVNEFSTCGLGNSTVVYLPDNSHANRTFRTYLRRNASRDIWHGFRIPAYGP